MNINEKKQYFFSKLPPTVLGFGFVPYKGRMWCYRPLQMLLYYIDCTFTRWGTLNEIEIGFGSFCAPIQNGKTKNTLNIGNSIDLCRHIRNKQGVSVYALYGENADSVFVNQINTLLPYVETEFERLFDEKYKLDLLGHMKILTDMQDMVTFDFALYQYMLGNIESAHDFLERRIASCEQSIEYVYDVRDRLPEEHFYRLCASYTDMIREVNKCAECIDKKEAQLLEIINKRIEESFVLCERFFRRIKKNE